MTLSLSLRSGEKVPKADEGRFLLLPFARILPGPK